MNRDTLVKHVDQCPVGFTVATCAMVQQVCGAQAAAHTYFAKRADQLTTDEAVWLAAMLHNPALEARRWAATGHINVERAQWVANGLRTTSSTRTAGCNKRNTAQQCTPPR